MNWNSQENKILVEAFISLKTAEETKRFLRDLMTEGEIEEFGKRLKAAEMLSAGNSYTAVEKATGFSSTTVARVSKWLNSGMGGYKDILAKMHHHNSFKRKKGLSLS